MKKIYKLTWDIPEYSYNIFESCVVIAATEKEAKRLHPNGGNVNWKSDIQWANSPTKVIATLLGTATEDSESGIVCASFIQE